MESAMLRFRYRHMALACLLLGGVGVVWASAAQAPRTPPARPQRIVSLNLCADQLILALADRDQIAGLTRNADRAEMSAAAAQARGLRILGSSAEEVLEIDPDLVVGMPARRGLALAGMQSRGYPTLDLKTAESLEEIEALIRQTAVALGHPQRGEVMVAQMRADLADIPRNGRGKVAAYYQRGGYMTGTGTLVDELMARAGLVNLAVKLGKPALSQMSLEEIVAAQPDFLIVESATDRVIDQGTEMLHHPAIAGVPRISMPQAWTVCGGPAYVLAARSIARQIAAQERFQARVR